MIFDEIREYQKKQKEYRSSSYEEYKKTLEETSISIENNLEECLKTYESVKTTEHNIDNEYIERMFYLENDENKVKEFFKQQKQNNELKKAAKEKEEAFDLLNAKFNLIISIMAIILVAALAVVSIMYTGATVEGKDQSSAHSDILFIMVPTFHLIMLGLVVFKMFSGNKLWKNYEKVEDGFMNVKSYIPFYSSVIKLIPESRIKDLDKEFFSEIVKEIKKTDYKEISNKENLDNLLNELNMEQKSILENE